MKSEQKPIFFDMETTGFYPDRCKIITIQVREDGKNTIWKEWDLGEKGVINEFYRFTNFKITRENAKFIGFNQLEFDLGFLTSRLYELKLDNLAKIWERFNRHLAWIDLRQLLGESVGHFPEWRKHFTGKSYGVASQMITIFYEKQEYTKIEEYIEDELEGFEQVFNAIKKEPFYLELQKLRDKLSNP